MLGCLFVEGGKKKLRYIPVEKTTMTVTILSLNYHHETSDPYGSIKGYNIN